MWQKSILFSGVQVNLLILENHSKKLTTAYTPTRMLMVSLWVDKKYFIGITIQFH